MTNYYDDNNGEQTTENQCTCDRCQGERPQRPTNVRPAARPSPPRPEGTQQNLRRESGKSPVDRQDRRRGDPKTQGPTGQQRSVEDARVQNLPRRHRDADDQSNPTMGNARTSYRKPVATTQRRPADNGRNVATDRRLRFPSKECVLQNVGDHRASGYKPCIVRCPDDLRPCPVLPCGAVMLQYTKHKIRNIAEDLERMQKQAACDPRTIVELKYELVNLNKVLKNKKRLLNALKHHEQNKWLPVEEQTTLEEWTARDRAAKDRVFNGWMKEHRAEWQKREAYDRAETERRDAYDRGMKKRWEAMRREKEDRRQCDDWDRR